jgi:hypothetical protein
VQVQALTYVEGSTPIDGSFVLSFGNASSGLPTTDLVRYDQAPLEFEYALESANVVGQASVAGAVRTMQPVRGVYLTVDKDATSVLVEYDSPKALSAAGVLEPGQDIRQMLAPGDVFRIGGAGPEGSTSAVAGAGAQSGIDEVLSEGSLGSDIAEIRKLARGEIDGVMRVARFDPMPSSSAAAVGAFSAAAMPQPEPYAEAAFVVRAREWPREGADSYGALPDTALVYADHFPRSALADDALYMTGEASAPEGAQGEATA